MKTTELETQVYLKKTTAINHRCVYNLTYKGHEYKLILLIMGICSNYHHLANIHPATEYFQANNRH